ncbi:hypothetical protein QUW58_02950 [Enterocloster aldenensis]|uniref:hypothetical protein n=1 Tax=Enterocloster aldenensis TaxID=358742 RepID=UPI0025A41E60|nr:hypothetical protein [Enterocloster aldenensis]
MAAGRAVNCLLGAWISGCGGSGLFPAPPDLLHPSAPKPLPHGHPNVGLTVRALTLYPADTGISILRRAVW